HCRARQSVHRETATMLSHRCSIFFFQAEDGIRDSSVTGVQTCALPISIGTQACWDPRVTQQACVPIVSHEKVVGVISIEGIETKLTLDDLDLLTTLAGYVSIALEKAQLYERTQVLATTDGLTGLLNYRAFWQALERELERSMRYGVPLSLIMIEIDQFKRFNDTYGHLRGDEVIRLVARVLPQEHRTQIDTIARYGGDEFMILLPHPNKIAAAEIAERVRRAVRAAPLSAVVAASVKIGRASWRERAEAAGKAA